MISSVSGESCLLAKDSKVLKYKAIGMFVVSIDFYSYLFSVLNWLKIKPFGVSNMIGFHLLVNAYVTIRV